MSSNKCCCRAPSAKPNRMLRPAGALLLVALGAAISLHLRASYVSHWWLPLAILVVGHGAILSGIAWIFARNPGRPAGALGHLTTACHPHEHGEHSKVIRTPRYYDWLVRTLTLGGERKFRRRTLDLAGLEAGARVLDVGCGTGTLLIEAAKRVGPSGSADGIEPSSEMVAHARHKAQAQGVRVHILEGSAERLPFADASFDAVFCTMVLHHLPATMQVAALGEMRRVLRPRGRLVLVDLQQPRSVSAALSLVTLFHRMGSRATAPDWQNLEALLAQKGFQDLERQAMWGGAVTAIAARAEA